MSITESKVIDIIVVPEGEPDNVVLVITDHLEWGDKSQQGEHLLLLQEKINTYIAFIESGELLESYPPAKGKNPKIRINGLYELPEQGKPLSTAWPRSSKAWASGWSLGFRTISPFDICRKIEASGG